MSTRHNELMPESNSNAQNANEILYKLGGLEAALRESMKRIDQHINDIKAEISKSKSETEVELADIKLRISNLESFKNQVVAKFSVVVLGIVGFWSIFGDFFHKILDRAFN